MTSIKKPIMFILFMSFLIVFAFILIGFFRPDTPAEWSEINIGMSRQEIKQLLGNELVDMKDLKGFDIATEHFKQWGFRDCSWKLKVEYNSENSVSLLEVRFTDKNIGIYNTPWESLRDN